LTLWEGNMTRRDGMATSVGGEAGKEGHNVGWVDANLTEPKNKVNLRVTIGR
jgi:hypothetical protein